MESPHQAGALSGKIVAIDYERQAIFIKWIGTHADYDKIDVRTVQYDRSTS
jgi:mRNA interferase HigB